MVFLFSLDNDRIEMQTEQLEKDENAWGQGIMSESLNAVIGFLFSEVGFNRIEAKHDPQNIASGKVMKKCRMTYEGTSRQARLRHDGKYYDLANYAVLRNDWFN